MQSEASENEMLLPLTFRKHLDSAKFCALLPKHSDSSRSDWKWVLVQNFSCGHTFDFLENEPQGSQNIFSIEWFHTKT